ncbi:macrophage mannose receptor 1 [Elysia marginata]|uniref:Macrophage mannose receptor 1 n=1 Tax=Elysia marginata TaxID=1093978 RepID=A0AAV4FWK2_9GAST|nr:macrophage mannose receptor 1 [Elysia marginata]
MAQLVPSMFCVLFLLTSATVRSSSDSDMGCKPGWTRVGDRCYRAESESDLLSSYSRAEETCEALAGELARVDSLMVDALAAALIPADAKTGYWILPGQTAEWYSKCLVLNGASTEKQTCSNGLGYICETGLVNITERYRGCSLSGTFGFRDKCYSTNAQSTDFNTAQAECEKNNGNLASVHDEETRLYLLSEFLSLSNEFWIGFSKEADNVYKWKSGDAVVWLPWEQGSHHGRIHLIPVACNQSGYHLFPIACSQSGHHLFPIACSQSGHHLFPMACSQ